MKLSMTCGPRLRCEQRVSLEQKHALDLKQNAIYLEMVEAIHGFRYTPHADCPKCGYKLDPVEILKGFRRDPNDVTTRCSKCKTRFEPRLVNFNALGHVEMPFYCPTQTIARLPGLETYSPEELQKHNSAVFHSAIYHFGTLKNAFAQIKIIYSFDEHKEWKEKVKPFLGRVPDTMIAKVADVNVKQVRRLRHSLGIGRFVKYEE